MKNKISVDVWQVSLPICIALRRRFFFVQFNVVKNVVNTQGTRSHSS